jgi:hypothetical protein
MSPSIPLGCTSHSPNVRPTDIPTETFRSAKHGQPNHVARRVYVTRFYPNMRIAASAGTVVAEERYRRSPRDTEPAFSFALP